MKANERTGITSAIAVLIALRCAFSLHPVRSRSSGIAGLHKSGRQLQIPESYSKGNSRFFRLRGYFAIPRANRVDKKNVSNSSDINQLHVHAGGKLFEQRSYSVYPANVHQERRERCLNYC